MLRRKYSIRALSWDRKEKFSDIFTALESVARIQSVKSSDEIKGIVSADDRIAQLVDGNSHPDMAANRMCKIFLALV